jgi:hypothetical protein
VLAEDLPFIKAMNATLRKSPDHQIRENLPPNPFAGPANAPVVLLLANPGFHEEDIAEQTTPEALPIILDAIRKPAGTPFWPLMPYFQGTRANLWWIPKTRDLASEVGGYASLSERIQSIELHGYHSVKWTAPLRNFPSQDYGFELVRRAMDRGALIIVCRAPRYWYSSVPGLMTYSRQVRGLASSRSVFLSRKNLGSHYRTVVRALRAE